MTDEHDGKRRWGIEQRLEFIEFRLFWDGVLNRADITKRFSVSAAQASADLGLYKELAPDNLEYDASQKRFVASPGFAPRLLIPNADRYLVQLKAIADKVISVDDTSIGVVPVADAMPVPHRRVDPLSLRRLMSAIRQRRGLNVLYHSMNAKRPLPIWRHITPHAFGYDGLRWHVRAYCHLEDHFKDFVLSRIMEIGDNVEPGKGADHDLDWNEIFDLVLEPNPRLAKAQQETIANDYEMEAGKLHMPIRRALLYYFNKRLRLDVADLVDDPKEAPIVVANIDEFRRSLSAMNT
jgi:hypothetical protein